MNGRNNFALIGAAGYIAPRHLKAIKDTGNRLIAVTDPHDSVGILDSFSSEVSYFREFERFDRYVEKIRGTGNEINYVSICSPNYLHDAHIRFALRAGANVVCEKPLVIKPSNCDALLEAEQRYGKRISSILQLRLHPDIIKLKNKVDNSKDYYNVDVSYITPRGKWYLYSWKGNMEQSGGLVTNIGIHLFDMLIWIFGKPENVQVNFYNKYAIKGSLMLEKAKVNWFLSINKEDLPKDKVLKTFRSIKVNGEEIEFSDGFTDLHTKSYIDILDGKGFGVEEAKTSIELVYDMRKYFRE